MKLESAKDNFFLFGARGTGKTTFIQHYYDNVLHLDLLKPQVLREYLAYPERLYDLIKANPEYNRIVIDEVQKAPQLLAVVHDLIESQPSLQFILTGSSSRKLKKAGVDLLGSRALRRNFYPFMPCELDSNFDIDSSLSMGLLPIVVEADLPKDKLQAYIDLYMQEEVRMEGLVRNIEAFNRFLEVISFSHASQVNVTNIASDSGVKRKAVENYLSILEDLLLSFRLQNFTHQSTRKLTAHPKFYLFDPGVYQALRPKHFGDGDATHLGPALEGLVAQTLRAWNDYSDDRHLLAFWRTRAGLEVDFVVYGEKNFIAIEVKNSNKIKESDLKSLRVFKKDYPDVTTVLLYRGFEKLLIHDVWCIPLEGWLVNVRPNCILKDIL